MDHNQIVWINENVSMRELLVEMGVDIPRNGVIFCPFHDNTRTPAAKFYDDSNKLWCFGEQKMYFSYNCMRSLNYTDERIFDYLPEDLSDYTPEKHIILFPVVPDTIKDLINKNYRMALFHLNNLWKNKKNVECKEI